MVDRAETTPWDADQFRIHDIVDLAEPWIRNAM